MIVILSSDYCNDARNSADHLPAHHPKVSESGARGVITRNLFRVALNNRGPCSKARE